MATRQWDLGALVFFLLVPWLYFGTALTTGSLLGPGDGLAQFLPTRVLAARAWTALEVPFWNPFTFGGMPLLGTLHPGVFFPGNMPFLFLPSVAALNMAVLSAFSLAGYATYTFCRALDTSRAGAVVAGATFMFSGFMVGHVVHLAVLQAAALVPALLWAVERLARTGARRYAITGSLLLAAAILAGHPQTVAYGMLLVGPYALWRTVGLAAAERWRFLGALAAGGALAVGLAFIQLIPALDMIPLTQRSAFSYQALLHDSLPPRQLATLLFPFLFGATGSNLFPVPYWGAGTDAVEGMAYAGLAGLTLAIVAAFTARDLAQARFWLVMLIVTLALACGDATPLFKLTTLVPPYNAMRAPGRHLLEAHLALSVLAGLGLSWLQATGAWKRLWLALGTVGAGLLAGVGLLALFGGTIASRLQPYFGVDLVKALSVQQPAVWVPLVVGVGLLPVAWVLQKRPSGWGPIALMAFLLVDLGLFGQEMEWNTLRPAPPVLPSYASETLPRGDSRVLAVSDRFGYFERDFMQDMVLPGPSALAGIRSAGGYDAFIKARYSRLLDGSTSGGSLKPSILKPGSHVLDLMGVSQIRLDPLLQAQGDWPKALEAGGYAIVHRLPKAWVYQNPDALPRAWRVEAARVLPEAEVDRHVMDDPGFDPRRVALLEEGTAPVVTSGTAEATANFFSLNRIPLRTHGTGPGLVVVSESYDPGWRAFSGTGELRVRRVDGAVIGVEVPAGPVAFELRYAPPRWGLALAVTGTSAVLLVVWGLWRCGYRRRARTIKS